MPTISYFRGINWNDYMPPHFHASYAGEEIIVSINDIEILEGQIPSKQQTIVLGRVDDRTLEDGGTVLSTSGVYPTPHTKKDEEAQLRQHQLAP